MGSIYLFRCTNCQHEVDSETKDQWDGKDREKLVTCIKCRDRTVIFGDPLSPITCPECISLLANWDFETCPNCGNHTMKKEYLTAIWKV